MSKLLYSGLLIAGAVSSSVAVRALTARETQFTPILMFAAASAGESDMKCLHKALLFNRHIPLAPLKI